MGQTLLEAISAGNDVKIHMLNVNLLELRGENYVHFNYNSHAVNYNSYVWKIPLLQKPIQPDSLIVYVNNSKLML